MDADDDRGPPPHPDRDEDRRERLVALLGRANGHGPAGVEAAPLARLGRVIALAVAELGVSGAGVTVMAGVKGGLAGRRAQLVATDDVSRRLEDLQLTSGEGPCLDAYREGLPVLVADLDADRDRWLGFGPEAVGSGAAAVFSLPLHVGVVRLGTLDLYRAGAGALTRDQLADALTVAGLATEILLEFAHDPGDGGMGGAGAGGEPGWLPGAHAVVHQASGMVAAHQHVGVGEALLRLRAHAFAHGRSVGEVAQHVVDRDLVLPGPHHPDDLPPDTDAESER